MKIVPTYRLIFLVGMVFLPVSLWFALFPGKAEISLTLVFALIILALVDGILSLDRLADIVIILPEVVRLSKGRNGSFSISILNKGQKSRKIRIGFAFSIEIESPFQDMTAVLPIKSDTSVLEWPLRGRKQGRYTLDRCFLEENSRIGLWAVRNTQTVSCEIRVYPNIFIERKNLSSLFLNRGIGIHAQRQLGKGREFEQLREYLPGDSYEDIHWKATAKRGQPITKTYQIERTQQIYIMVDTSRLSARHSVFRQNNGNSVNGRPINGKETSTILERYITATLIMALAAERQGDFFGLMTFSDQVQSFVGAKNGKAHYNACRDVLYTLEPKIVSPDFSELFTFIGNRIRRRALLIFLTNLDDPVLAENFTKNINVISRRHVILVNMLKPEGAVPIFSSHSVSSSDEIYQNLGGHLVWKHLNQTEKILYRHGIDFSWWSNEHLCTELISKYLSVKQRQIL